MSAYDQHYKCSCGWFGTEDFMEEKCLFAGSLEEPPEWTRRCPSCGQDWDFMEEIDPPEEY